MFNILKMFEFLSTQKWNQNKNYYVVRNAGCARSRYTLTLSINESMNELMNYQSISRTAHPPLKTYKSFGRK